MQTSWPDSQAFWNSKRGVGLWVGAASAQAEVSAWLGQAVPAASPARWESEVQAQLLQQAAQQSKSHAGAST